MTKGILAVLGLAIGLLPAVAEAQKTKVSAELVSRLCAGRKPCALVSAKPAGRDGSGRAITVVELSLGKIHPDKAITNPRFGCRPYRRELWRVGAGAPARLLDLCNDGYGAAGVGEDEVEIGRNRLRHDQSGGSAWRWSNSRTLQLSPLRVTKQSSCFFHTGSTGFELAEWNWTKFRGQGGLAIISKCRKPGDDEEQGACELDKAQGRFVLIPKIAMRVRGAPVLGSCAATIDGAGRNGFVVFGKRSTGQVPWLKALLISDRILLVTVADKRFSKGNSSNWIHDDHIEIWQGKSPNHSDCREAKGALKQWGLRIADARVFAGHGRADALTVLSQERREVGGLTIASFRLRLPSKAEGLTVVYSKAARGRQSLLFATSRIKFRDHTTLGQPYTVPKGAARCAMRKGALDVIQSGNYNAIRQAEK